MTLTSKIDTRIRQVAAGMSQWMFCKHKQSGAAVKAQDKHLQISRKNFLLI